MRLLLSAALALFSGLLQQSAVPSPASIDFRVPDTGTSPVCRVHSDKQTTPVAINSNRTLRLSCKTPAVLECDFADAQPVDVSVGAICNGTGGLEIVPARAIKLSELADGPFDLDWLRWDEGDPSPTVTATRHWSDKFAGQILVSKEPANRLLRLRRPKLSPVTVNLGVVTDEVSFPSVPGGEVVVRRPKSLVTPVALSVGNSSSSTFELGDGPISFPGLPADEVDLSPVYYGGLRGARVRSAVALGTSTYISLKGEEVGQLDVQADELSCNRALHFTLATAVEGSSQIVYRSDTIGPCRWIIAGLAPGQYIASLAGDRGPVSTGTALVANQQVTRGSLTFQSVVVHGQITMNHKPGQNLSVALSSPVLGGDAVMTRTNSAGFFDATVPLPGQYSVQLRALPLFPTQSKSSAFQPGENEFDWEIDAGVLIVRIKNWLHTPLQFNLTGKSPVAGIVTYEGKDEVTLAGLPFGAYELTASDGTRSTAQPSRTEISESSPEATVTIDLVTSQGELRVQGADGSALSGATAIAGARVLRETDTGVFSLKGVPAGTAITVTASGYVPSCRVAAGETTSAVILTRPLTDVDVWYDRPINFPPGTVFGMPKADCGVPANMFSWTVLGVTDSSAHVSFHNLSDVRSLIYDVGGVRQQFLRGEDGKILLRVPPQKTISWNLTHR